ncbi:hypothetical protein PN498_12595 [Oscillatoria sp. CS-180]|uniref:hypothetical protein n=1 Tax=Oscillatoria sp. CS-180 TaxID=3021720 RepID=UPI00232F3682|nr:hypothetical protein [Oscillatoria sp. CS-180]MDB9526830.1 hypothetical protein [Oscillatoria sp. CS-180]
MIHWLGWDIWTFDPLTGTLFAAASFVIAFMLSGTLRDYSSSADMPIELATAIEAIEDANLLVANRYPDYAPEPLRKELRAIAQAILAWLQDGQPIESIDHSLERLTCQLTGILEVRDVPVISRIQSEQSKIRLLVYQIRRIRDTDFLKPAYALLEFFLLGATVTLLLVETISFIQNLVVSSLLFTAFAYLLRLIRDLDNPFQYEGRSSLDADLSGLQAVCDRLS